jgi:hypothetical protein
MSFYNRHVIFCQRDHHWISLPRSQFALPIQYGDWLLEDKRLALCCGRNVSKPYLFWRLGLAFERKADAPSCCKETKIEGSNGRFREVSAACKAGALPAELHAHSRNYPSLDYVLSGAHFVQHLLRSNCVKPPLQPRSIVARQGASFPALPVAILSGKLRSLCLRGRFRDQAEISRIDFNEDATKSMRVLSKQAPAPRAPMN